MEVAPRLDSSPAARYHLAMIGPNHKPPEEWLLQADYDMDTAQYMFDGGRYFYTVFMCHLSIKKAIKSLYSASLKVEPPKLHDLLYFSNRLRLHRHQGCETCCMNSMVSASLPGILTS